MDEKERELKDINEEIKDILGTKGNDYKISCSFFSSKSYKDYLSKIEEYEINNVKDLFKKF